jgi:AcrR family transcriptional regulator
MITRKEKPASGTRDRIVDASLRLFVSQGIAGTTTRDIAKEAEIAEGTIYRHFESKEALAAEIFMETFKPLSHALVLLEGAEGPVLERIGRTVDHFYRLFDEDPTRWVYVMTYQTGRQSKLPPGTPTPFTLMLKMLKEGTASGELRDLDADLHTQVVLGMITQPAMGIVYDELDGPLAPRAAEVMQAIRKVLAP